MSKSHGNSPKKRTWKLIEALLDYVENKVDNDHYPDYLKFNRDDWKNNCTLKLETTYGELAILLYGREFWSKRPIKYQKNDKKTLSESVIYYLGTFLKIAERHLGGKGVKNLHLTLKLWHQDKSKNEEEFKKAWEKARLNQGLQQLPEKEENNENQYPDLQSQHEDTELFEKYVERPPIENNCSELIKQPGALIRIKAPQKMGKTLLMKKILHYARNQEEPYQTVELSFDDTSIFDNYEYFLKWFCLYISDSLKIKKTINESWQEGLGLQKNVTKYFEEILLPSIQNNLVIAIDDFEVLFDFEGIFRSFCSLIRSWYNNARGSDKSSQMWRKLRVIIVNSTQLYPKLDKYRSPFNVGKTITLRGFTTQEIEILMKKYQLQPELVEKDIKLLIDLLDGHPDLIQETFAYLKNEGNNLEKLLTTASTEEGIFCDHLVAQLEVLEEDPSLLNAYKKVIMSNEPVRLERKLRFKLSSLGLIKILGNDCVSSCNLYRQYFFDILINQNQTKAKE